MCMAYGIMSVIARERPCTAPEGRPCVSAAHDFPSFHLVGKGVKGMDVNNVMQIVGQFGFPIACCVALFCLIIKMNEQHKEEMAKVTEALNNNTLAITKLNERLNHGEN